MKEIVAQMNEVMDALKVDLEKALAGNKAAAARARKGTTTLANLGKEFRKTSIAEMK